MKRSTVAVLLVGMVCLNVAAITWKRLTATAAPKSLSLAEMESLCLESSHNIVGLEEELPSTDIAIDLNSVFAHASPWRMRTVTLRDETDPATKRVFKVAATSVVASRQVPSNEESIGFISVERDAEDSRCYVYSANGGVVKSMTSASRMVFDINNKGEQRITERTETLDGQDVSSGMEYHQMSDLQLPPSPVSIGDSWRLVSEVGSTAPSDVKENPPFVEGRLVRHVSFDGRPAVEVHETRQSYIEIDAGPVRLIRVMDQRRLYLDLERGIPLWIESLGQLNYPNMIGKGVVLSRSEILP